MHKKNIINNNKLYFAHHSVVVLHQEGSNMKVITWFTLDMMGMTIDREYTCYLCIIPSKAWERDHQHSNKHLLFCFSRLAATNFIVCTGCNLLPSNRNGSIITLKPIFYQKNLKQTLKGIQILYFCRKILNCSLFIRLTTKDETNVFLFLCL